MIGEPRTLLRKREVKQQLSITERILEVRATTSGSDISVASFADSSVDLTEVAGRHGIEIADQASCAAGSNPLSSSGHQRFWHVHCTLAPKLIIYISLSLFSSGSPFPALLNYLCNHVSSRLEIKLRLYVRGMRWQHMQGRYFLSATSRLPGSWTLVTLQVLLDGSRALLKHTTENETLNVARGGMSSNASCIMSCLRPLTQSSSSSTDVVRSSHNNNHAQQHTQRHTTNTHNDTHTHKHTQTHIHTFTRTHTHKLLQ